MRWKYKPELDKIKQNNSYSKRSIPVLRGGQHEMILVRFAVTRLHWILRTSAGEYIDPASGITTKTFCLPPSIPTECFGCLGGKKYPKMGVSIVIGMENLPRQDGTNCKLTNDQIESNFDDEEKSDELGTSKFNTSGKNKLITDA